jgi:hypothetical protein
MPCPEGAPSRNVLFIKGALFCEDCLRAFESGELKLP